MSASSVPAAVGNFFTSISHVGSSLFHAVLALFGAILSFGQAILSSAVETGQAMLKLGTDLVQSVVGFIFANLFLITLVGGGVYLYRSREAKGKGRK